MNVLRRVYVWLKERLAKKVDSFDSYQFWITLVLFAHNHNRKILLPKNLDIDTHVHKYPPSKYGYNSKLKFNVGKIYYLLSLLTHIPARNKDLITDDGWVPISMAIVRNNIKDIIWYKDYLIATGVIECDNVYIPNEKAYWYRWSPVYIDSEFELRDVLCPHEDKAYFASEEDRGLMNYPYLTHWYESNLLSIDRCVLDYSKSIYQAKMQGLLPKSINSSTNQPKNPKTQYEASIVNIDKIFDHNYEVHIDTTVHRLHSVITNMQSDFRNFLSYDGKELVNIDIHNSQPYLACLLLNPMFWDDKSPLPISIGCLHSNIQDLFNHHDVMSEIREFFKSHNTSEFQLYIKNVASGKFYEEFVDVAKSKLGLMISRKEAKTLMFYILFSSNKGQHDNPTINELKKLFSHEVYPQVAELFKIIKRSHKSIKAEKQHNRLACLLQSIESEIILHRVCKRIWIEHNQQVPIFTIHDSIATTIPNKDIVYSIMKEELTKAIGISPCLDASLWNIKNVKYPNLLYTCVDKS